jgi:hypothetical protein
LFPGKQEEKLCSCELYRQKSPARPYGFPPIYIERGGEPYVACPKAPIFFGSFACMYVHNTHSKIYVQPKKKPSCTKQSDITQKTTTR